MNKIVDYKEYMDSGDKIYVSVIELRYKDGRVMPLSIIWEHRRLKIDKVLDICNRASLKAGGVGLCYTITIGGQKKYLFLEEDGSGAKWFVERKTS